MERKNFDGSDFKTEIKQYPDVAQRQPIAAPANTSDGQCTPTAILEIPVSNATIINAALIAYLLNTYISNEARIKIVAVCPDGKE